MHRSNERGLQRRKIKSLPTKHIALDKKRFKKVYKYAPTLSDPLSGCLIDADKERTEETANPLMCSTFPKEQLQ